MRRPRCGAQTGDAARLTSSFQAFFDALLDFNPATRPEAAAALALPFCAKTATVDAMKKMLIGVFRSQATSAIF